MTFPVTLLDPVTKKTLVVRWLEAMIDGKKLIIQYGHAPFIASLDAQKEMVLGFENGTQENIIIKAGILMVERTKVTVLQE